MTARYLTWTGALLLATAAAAPAQLYPGVRPGAYFINPYISGPYATAYNRPSMPSIYGPSLYGSAAVGYGAYGPSPTGYAGYSAATTAAAAQTGYLNGGVGLYAPAMGPGAVNPVVAEQVRLARAAAGMNRGNAAAARKAVADQWAFEQNGPGGRAGVVNGPAASPAQVESGDALNGLVAAIAGLQAKGAKADAPLLPADLLAALAYGPGPSADMLSVLRGGRPEVPVTISGPEWDAVRAKLQAAWTPVVEAVVAGKKPAPAAADRLTAEVKAARDDLAPAVRGAGFAEASAVVRFLNGLDSLARIGKDSQLSGAYDPAWTTVGATAADLVKHMRKYQLTFAPAPAGADDAYDALYRGLAGYHQALAAAAAK